MLRKALNTLISLWLLAASSPAFAFVCERPCAMSKGRMLACAKACALAKRPGHAEISRPDCTRAELHAGTGLFSLGEAAKLRPASGFAVMPAPAVQAPICQARLAKAGRGPPAGFPTQVDFSIPQQNAPPAI